MGKRTSLLAGVSRPAATLSITSLMDVLTIILIFLLVNFSEVAQEGELPRFITLPTVKTEKKITSAQAQRGTIVVAVGKHRIDVNKETIKLRQYDPAAIIDQTTALLNKYRKEYKKNKHSAVISLQADKDIPYNYIDAILVSAGYAGITQVNFITLREEK